VIDPRPCADDGPLRSGTQPIEPPAENSRFHLAAQTDAPLCQLACHAACDFCAD
jgi:hypothetical protein